MPKLENSNETFWLIFKHCEVEVTTKELKIPFMYCSAFFSQLLAVFLFFVFSKYGEKGINQPFYNFLVMAVVVLKEVASKLKCHSFVHQITITS